MEKQKHCLNCGKTENHYVSASKNPIFPKYYTCMSKEEIERAKIRNWNNWDNLPVEELQRRQKVLQEKSDHLAEVEKELRDRDDYVWRNEHALKSKTYEIENLISRLGVAAMPKKEWREVIRRDLRRLLSFEVRVKDGKETKTVPLFCETALYNLVGKDDARSILHLMETLCEDAGLTKEEMRESGI